MIRFTLFTLLYTAALCSQTGTRPIGREPQLFLDDYSIERTSAGIRKVLHQPVKRGVIQDERGDFGIGDVYLGNLVARDDSQRFHMLYRYPWDDPSVARLHPSIGVDKAQSFRELTGCAVSEDGIRWKKPVLGLAEAPSSFRRERTYTVAASSPPKTTWVCRLISFTT